METLAPRLVPLTCEACGGLVPLVNAAATPCPFCGAVVPIPPAYQQHKASLEALLASQRAARQLYAQLGRAPSKLFRAFAFFDSVWFWLLGLGFWITLAMFVVTWLVPIVGRLLFRVNTVDVLSEQASMMLLLGGSMGSVVFGLLLSAWGRRRAIARGGLQAALAAQAPAAEGGPARCRVCGAALSFGSGALGARCDYCSADNLLKIPPEWSARMRKLNRSIEGELDAAATAWKAERARLRTSLLVRLVLGGLVVGVPLAILGSSAPSSSYETPDAARPPVGLPRWEPAPWTAPCTTAFQAVRVSDRCTKVHCEAYALTALEHGALEVMTSELPEGSEVVLEAHRQTLLSDLWVVVDRSAAQPTAELEVPLSGWYRLLYRVPVATGGWVHTCVQWVRRPVAAKR